MPSHVPRLNPVKKREELALRKQILQNAILNNYPESKLYKAAEKYRAAQIGLLKATIHFIMEKDYQNKTTTLGIVTIEAQIAVWSEKLLGDIIEVVTHEICKS